MNCYPEMIDACTHATKEKADRLALSNRLACLKVVLDFQEGEGL